MELKIIMTPITAKSEKAVIKVGFTKIPVLTGSRVSISINFILKIKVKISWFTNQSVETEH